MRQRKARLKPRFDWPGVDPRTSAYAHALLADHRLTPPQHLASRRWFASCLAAGVSTDLDADFNDGALAAHLGAQLERLTYPGLVKVRLAHVEKVRAGLRIYVHAFSDGLRKRQVPPIAVVRRMGFAHAPEVVLARLPAADQRKIARLEELLKELGRLQWAGMGGPRVKGPDGRARKPTISPKTASGHRSTLRSFLHFAYQKGWRPYTLAAWVTPEHLCAYLFHGETHLGGKLALKTITVRISDMLDIFYRGRVHRPTSVTLMTEREEERLRKMIARERTRQHTWNARPARESNTGAAKWYPSIRQVELAIAALNVQIQRADERFAAGRMGRRAYWLELRSAVMALCAIYGMWRVDTVSTISLSHLRQDPETGSATDADGFATVLGIARAKNTDGKWFPFVPELVIPSPAVPYIRKLLAFEGRTLEAPLRSGERPVRLSANGGDSWGGGKIPEGELEVVPLFRRHADDPAPLSYVAVQGVLERQLRRLRFGATNAHTFRALGAIFWSFIVGLPQSYVMRIGLWESAATLEENYARIGLADQLRLMAAFIPPTPGAVPVVPTGVRERAAADAIAVFTQMLVKPTNAPTARRLLEDVQRHCERISQTIASELGFEWEPIRADRLGVGEDVHIDETLRALGHEGGLAGLLGRPWFPAEHLAAIGAGTATKRPAQNPAGEAITARAPRTQTRTLTRRFA